MLKTFQMKSCLTVSGFYQSGQGKNRRSLDSLDGFVGFAEFFCPEVNFLFQEDRVVPLESAQMAVFHPFPDGIQKNFGIYRLQEKIMRSFAQGPQGVIQIAVPRDKNHRDRIIDRPHIFEYLKAVHLRHADIGDHQIRQFAVKGV